MLVRMSACLRELEDELLDRFGACRLEPLQLPQDGCEPGGQRVKPKVPEVLRGEPLLPLGVSRGRDPELLSQVAVSHDAFGGDDVGEIPATDEAQDDFGVSSEVSRDSMGDLRRRALATGQPPDCVDGIATWCSRHATRNVIIGIPEQQDMAITNTVEGSKTQVVDTVAELRAYLGQQEPGTWLPGPKLEETKPRDTPARLRAVEEEAPSLLPASGELSKEGVAKWCAYAQSIRMTRIDESLVAESFGVPYGRGISTFKRGPLPGWMGEAGWQRTRHNPRRDGGESTGVGSWFWQPKRRRRHQASSPTETA